MLTNAEIKPHQVSETKVTVLTLQVVHGLLSELEHDNQLPRRLVAAVPSMFASAAGQR